MEVSVKFIPGGKLSTDEADTVDVPFLRTSQENISEREQRQERNVPKVVYTCCLCGAYFVFGWTYEQMGPALLDLQYNTKVNLTYASIYMTVVNVAHIVGSLVSSVLYGRIHTSLILLVSIVGVAAAVSVIPWSTTFLPMLIAHCVQGVFGGSMDSAVLAEMLALWGSESESPLQGLYFSFAFGATLSPLCVTPFLRDISKNIDSLHNQMNYAVVNKTPSLREINSSISISVNSTYIQNSTDFLVHSNFSETKMQDSSELYIPYSISAGLCLLVAIPFVVFLVLYVISKFSIPLVTDEVRVTKSLSRRLTYVILLVTGLISGFDTGIEDAYGDFFSAFCVSHMGWSKQNGGFLTSVFHGSFAFGRFLGIFLAICVKPLQLLISYSVLLCVVNVCFIFSGLYKFSEGIWICSVFAGIGMSVVSPSIFTLTEESFLPVTGRIAAYYVIMACLASGLNAFFIGFLMDTYSSMYLAYVLCTEGFLIFLLSVTCRILLYIINETSEVSTTNNIEEQ